VYPSCLPGSYYAYAFGGGKFLNPFYLIHRIFKSNVTVTSSSFQLWAVSGIMKAFSIINVPGVAA
jgi:hypothetical protein